MFGYIFILAAIFCYGVSYYFYHQTKTYKAEAIRATGEVKELKESRSSSGRLFYPIVEFTPENENPVEFQGKIGSDPPRYKVGDQVSLIYERNRPMEARIDSLLNMHFRELIAAAVGTFFILFGIIFTLVFS